MPEPLSKTKTKDKKKRLGYLEGMVAEQLEK